jgi:hypothetical protein
LVGRGSGTAKRRMGAPAKGRRIGHEEDALLSTEIFAFVLIVAHG